MPCLDAWEWFLYDDSLPPLLHAALAHSQFEAIHRVGLLMWNDFSYFEATRAEYYARLLGVTERGEWEEWLIYFLRGVALQSDDAVNRIQRIDDLLSHWKQGLARSQSRLPERALDFFTENPFWTVGGVAGRLEVAFTTAQRAIDRLEEAGVVARVGEARRNRVYCAGAILDVLEEPLHVAD